MVNGKAQSLDLPERSIYSADIRLLPITFSSHSPLIALTMANKTSREIGKRLNPN